MILDTTFLVDFERERRGKKPGAAHQFLQQHLETRFAITFTVAGELAAGRSLGSDRAAWEMFLRPFRFLDYTAEVGWVFGSCYRDLQASGTLIGSNDLWIASTALVHKLPVVTRNACDFERIRTLEVLTY
jgi:predicted nucleic acid-binding protein